MTSRSELLARRLARNSRWYKVFTVVALLGLLTVLGVTAISPIVEERRAFTASREDFISTWCNTYGVDPTNPATDAWRSYVERHADYLSANFDELEMSSARELDGTQIKRDGIIFSIEEYETGVWQIDQYWFGLGFPLYFAFFQFGENWDPPTCD